MHENHRQRMRDRFSKQGLDGFSEHEIVEVLLYYIIPRRNTNEIAHRLVERFGNSRGILQASEAGLCSVDGVSQKTASSLRFLLEFFGHVARQNLLTGNRLSFDSTEALLAYAYRQYLDKETESPMILLFDGKGVLLATEFLAPGTFSRVQTSTSEAMRYAFCHNAARILLFHQHSDGILQPSESDLQVTHHWVYLFDSIGCPLEEHYILTDTRAYGILQKESFDLPRAF